MVPNQNSRIDGGRLKRVLEVITAMRMLWETTKRTGGRNQYQVIDQGFLTKVIITRHVRGLADRVVSDNPTKVYKARANERCKKGYYKVMMFVSPGRPTNYIRQGDFHFYKQHGVIEYKIKPGDTIASVANFFKIPVSRIRGAGSFKVGKRIVFRANVFSHKRGWATGPLLKDARGNMIKDPRTSSRDYSTLNYKLYCGSFCVKNRGIKVGKTHPKVGENTV